MAPSATITIRVDQKVKDRLEASAKQQKRSKSFLAAEAIEEYLRVQEWQEQRIKQALAGADRGELIAHEKVAKWVDSLGTKDELPAPKV